MNIRDVERLEYKLEQVNKERDGLKDQNQEQKRTIEALRFKIEELEKIINQHPMPIGEAMENPLAQEGQLHLLQETIKGYTYQLSYTQQARQNFAFQLTEVQSKFAECESQLQCKAAAVQTLSQKIQFLQRRERMQDEVIETLNRRLDIIGEQKLQLINEKAELNQALRKEQKYNLENITEIAEGIGSLKNFLEQDKPNIEASPQAANQESRLLKIQQEELQARNEEILRLRSALTGISVSSEESHLKNTIKHLRGQIGRFNKMMKQIVEQSMVAESLIKKYEQSLKRYQHEIEMISSLKEQNITLKNQMEGLRLVLQEAEAQLQKEKKCVRETKIILVQALTENQCYHELMYQSYPENYKNYISLRKKAYLQRLQDRRRSDKWVSVEELVNVNENLRRKLKMI